MIGKEGYEVTTYRIDGDYQDFRHPQNVTFTSSLKEDLRRRDFTINAMAYAPGVGLVDEFGGLDDLKRGIIRCVGDPVERFSEDALRMMRAVRFAAQLGFSVEDKTREAICQLAGNLINISAERVQVELVKTLISPHPDMLRLAYECGITAVVLPEFDRIMEQRQETPHHLYNTGEHTLVALQNVRADRVLRLATLFHDMGKPQVFTTDENGRDHFKGHAVYSEIIANSIMRRLKFDTDTIRKVRILVRNHSDFPEPTGRGVRRSANRIGGRELFNWFLEIKCADIKAHHPDVIERNLNYLDEVERIWAEIQERRDCLCLKELAITGGDLIADGMKPGPKLGELLQLLLEEVLDFPERNEKELLLLQSREIRRSWI
jgi:tRNA nucleotidyltransferase (CCA-adding enzyme)